MAQGREWRFAWVASDDIAFDPVAHDRLDLDPVSVELDEQEEQDATFTIIVDRSSFGSLGESERWAWLSFMTLDGVLHPVALGQRTTVPLGKKEEDVVLDFVCRPSDLDVRRQIALAPKKVLPFFDPVLVDPSRLQDPVEILDGYTECVHVHRITHAVSTVDMLAQGLPLYRTFTADDIGDWDEGGVTVESTGAPLAGVLIRLSCQFEQEISGSIDLSSSVEQAFSEGVVCTLTPDQFEKSWFKPGSVVGGDSGYVITSAKLSRIDAPPGKNKLVGPVRGSSAVYNYVTDPNLSAPIIRNASLAVSYYDVTLTAGFEFRQKRTESIQLLVMDGGQKTHLGTKVRTLDLRCSDVTKDLVTNEYRPGVAYGAGAVVRAQGRTWVCIRDHVSAGDFSLDYAVIEGGLYTEHWNPVAVDNSPIGGRDRSTYFRQPRGVSTVATGVAKARRLLALACRNVEVSFTVPFETVIDLTTRARVRVEVPGNEIPGGWVDAKITAIRVTDTDPETGYAKATIKLRACTGTGAAPPVTPENSLYQAAGDPAATLGIDGDWYLNTASGVLFGPKQSGAWPMPGADLGQLSGLPAGTAYHGTLHYAPLSPNEAVGDNGDFWLMTSANTLYGPKANSAWPTTGLSLGGPLPSPGGGFGNSFPVNVTGQVWDAIQVFDYTGVQEPQLPAPTGGVWSVNGPDAQLAFVQANDFDPGAGRADAKTTDPTALLRQVPTSVGVTLSRNAGQRSMDYALVLPAAIWPGPLQIDTGV